MLIHNTHAARRALVRATRTKFGQDALRPVGSSASKLMQSCWLENFPACRCFSATSTPLPSICFSDVVWPVVSLVVHHGARASAILNLKSCLTLSDPHSKRFKIVGGCAQRSRTWYNNRQTSKLVVVLVSILNLHSPRMRGSDKVTSQTSLLLSLHNHVAC